MKRLFIALLVALPGWAAPSPAAAQPFSGFGTFTISSDVNHQLFAGASGGVLLDVLDAWLSLGAQGDVFFAHGYAAGRGGPLAHFNIVRRPPLRIFATGGFAWGEQGGPMVGAGVDLWTSGRIGLRASVQDYLARIEGFDCAFFGLDQATCDAQFHSGRSFTGHQPSVQVGIIWR